MEIERTLTQWSIGGPRIRWSAIFAGWAVGLASQMVLTLLGLAVGAWTIDLGNAEPVGGVPIGTGLWTGMSMLIAAFVGGYVTARLSGSPIRTDGLYHGLVVWGVNWLVFTWLTTTAMATMLGGVFSVFGSTLHTLGQGATTVASAAVSKLSSQNFSISTDELRKQAESILQATAKKELQPGEIQKDTERVAGSVKSGQPPRQVADTALQELQEKLLALDREAAVNVMTAKMSMTEPQARQLVQSTIGLLAPLKDTAQQFKEQSIDVGNQSIHHMGTLAMWLCALALITLALSITGGMSGIRNQDAIQGRQYGEVQRAS